MRHEEPGSRRWPFGPLMVLAAVAGLAATASFAPYSWWPLGMVAVATLSWAVRRTRGVGRAALLGWAFGLTFMATSLHWQTSIMVESYAGLVAVTSLMYALIGALSALSSRLPGWPMWSAAAWSVGEGLLSVWPFGGFMWMRLGYGQVDGPLAGFYPFAGAASVTFLVALLAQLLVAFIESPSLRRGGVTGGVALGVLGLGWAGTAWMPADTTTGSVNVGWVQGGAPGGGIYGLGPARTITRNEVRETDVLMKAVESGSLPAPDFIVWPENSTDLDPTLDAQTRALVDSAVARARVPILVGAVLEDQARDERQTVSIWWTDEGPQQVYSKRNLVPFGEWIPLRPLLLPLIPALQYVGAQSVPGTEPGVIDAGLPSVPSLRLGLAICYEVIYPQTLFDVERAGADLVVVVSSNAMYQGTNQIDQQFAITRVRAAEMRRDLLVVTTSGVSGRIDARGGVVWTAPAHIAASGVETLPLAHPLTPAEQWSGLVELLLIVVGVGSALVGLVHSVRTARRGRMDQTSTTATDA